MNFPVVTFFMIVTDPDIVIADYSIRSYAKITDLPFRLRVYSNWVSSSLKKRYFADWVALPFVDLQENEWQTDAAKPNGPGLEGPYEKGAAIWDRELQKLETPFFATVDADFEILDAEFISVMLDRFAANPNLVAIATDRNSTMPRYYDTYTDRVICLQERLGTWFCIYRREAQRCTVSHLSHEERDADSPYPKVWDDGGRFQKALRETYGYELDVLDAKYSSCFIHYGAFSKNCDLDARNIGLYRRLRILARRGIFRRRNSWINILFRGFVFFIILKLMYGHVDRSKYWNQVGRG
jgi:hypothetical protein